MATKKTTTVVEEEVNAANEHDLKVAAALEGKDDVLQINAADLDDEKVKEEKLQQDEAAAKEEADAKAKADEEARVAEAEKLKEEVTKGVKEEIVSQLQGTKEEKKDAYAEFEKEIWAKEKRTPTYQEALDFVKTQAKEEIKSELNAEIEEENKAKEEEIKAQEVQQQQINENLNKDWDDQLDDLVKSGKIPPIAKPDDNRVQIVNDASGKEIERIPLEPGKRARYDLFKAMYIVTEGRVGDGLKPITNLKEIYYEHYNPGKQPAGANAPIAGVRKSVSQDSGSKFNYSDIHNKPMEDLLREA